MERDELDELSGSLRELRERAGLSQPDAAARAGISQSMLSRAETGRKILDVEAVQTLATVYAATSERQRRLLELATQMQPSTVDSRLVMQRGRLVGFQERLRNIERSCATVRAYQPGMILGALQTADYARAVFTAPRPSRPADSDPPEALVATRLARYRQLAADPGRHSTFVMTQAVLDWHVVSPRVMAEQMDHLLEASELPTVELGIIRARTPSRVFAPHGFTMFDSRAVHIGTKTATALTTDESDIADYEYLFTELAQMAVFDDEARALIRASAETYRNL
ncbi:MAG TPA: helix-turn-helix transcriptional regulator [Pseudonocardia sp.]|jgi:transcriptional regulator with XRE-family HTH domain